jgi:hypothetical protein
MSCAIIKTENDRAVITASLGLFEAAAVCRGKVLDAFSDQFLPRDIAAVIHTASQGAVLAVVPCWKPLLVCARALLGLHVADAVLAAVGAVLDFQGVDVHVAKRVRTIFFVAGVSVIPVFASAT